MPTKRKLSKTTRVSNESKELRQIEKLLGDEFDTLAQARRALKRESVPVKQTSKKAAKSVPKKAPTKVAAKTVKKAASNKPTKAYTLKELNGEQRRALSRLLLDESNAKELDKHLLKPGDQWGAIIQYNYTGQDLNIHKGQARTYKLYGRLDQLFRELTRYVTHGLKQKATPKRMEKFLSEIKIVQWGDEHKTQRENRLAWSEAKDKEVAARIERKKGVKKMIRDVHVENRKLKRQLASANAKIAAAKTAKKAAKKKK